MVKEMKRIPEWLYPLYKPSDKKVFDLLLCLGNGKIKPKVIGSQKDVSEFVKLLVVTQKMKKYRIFRDMVLSELQKKGKLYYQIENPKRLVKFAKDQVKLAGERLENAKKALPDFVELIQLSPVRPKIRFADGLTGLMSLYESHVLEKEPYEMLGISNTTELTKVFPKKFVLDYINKKKKLGIGGRAIFPDCEKDKNYLKEYYKNYPKKILPQIKYVPAKIFPYRNEITIYGKNKVSIINFKQKDTVGIIIEDQTIHDMMRMIFELAWTGATEFAKLK